MSIYIYMNIHTIITIYVLHTYDEYAYHEVILSIEIYGSVPSSEVLHSECPKQQAMHSG